MTEDLGLCYPTDYYTHVRPSPSTYTAAALRQAGETGGTLRRERDRLRAQIVAAVTQRDSRGSVLVRGMAKSRKLRERAFHDRVIDELIPRQPTDRRALDVGCGNGRLLDALSSLGWKADGVEWDPTAAEIARTATGCHVWTGDFLGLPLPDEAYELVVLSHVFEHLEEPIPALRRLRQLLAPTGRLVVITPNAGSVGARLFRSAWWAWDPPRHLIVLGRKSWSVAARRANLLLSGRTTAGDAGVYFAHSRNHTTGGAGSDPPPVGKYERALAAVEAVLVTFRVQVGEESITVLTADHQ